LAQAAPEGQIQPLLMGKKVMTHFLDLSLPRVVVVVAAR
jgi:hypothetical protein